MTVDEKPPDRPELKMIPVKRLVDGGDESEDRYLLAESLTDGKWIRGSEATFVDIEQ